MTNKKTTRIDPFPSTSLIIGKVSIDVETGKISFPKGYKPDETAREFWKFIDSCRPDVVSREEIKRVLEGLKGEKKKEQYKMKHPITGKDFTKEKGEWLGGWNTMLNIHNGIIQEQNKKINKVIKNL